jgi:hypothetical protein
VIEEGDELADRLPAGYLEGLEAFAAGESDEAVAARIGVDPSAATAAVRVATGKLLATARELQQDAGA